MSGAAVEPGARMSRSANMPKPVDRGRVAAQGSERPPEHALVELSGAAVRIAIHGVGVAGEEIGRCQDVDSADFVAQIGSVPRDPVQHPVSIALGQRLGPAVRRVEFPGRVATGSVRYLLQLQPQSGRARRYPGRVQQVLLADYHRGVPRQESGLRLRARDPGAGRTVGEMDQRNFAEPRVVPVERRR